MDRASDYGSEGWGFESSRARQVFQALSGDLLPSRGSWEAYGKQACDDRRTVLPSTRARRSVPVRNRKAAVLRPPVG